MKLKDKVAIITGGAKGIGKDTSILFAKEGATVICCDYDGAAGQEFLKELRQINQQTFFYEVDVTNRQQIKNMVDDVKDSFGRIDILVNNAGITADGMLHKLTEEHWDRVIDVNLKGVFNCTQAVVEIMRNQGRGKIINTSSVVGIYGNIGQTNYAATKAGVIGLTKSWAKELGTKGINVNGVAPGYVMSDMMTKVPQKIIDMIKQKTPFGRLGTPLDIAKAYLFLASEDSDYVTGTVLSVDGGLVL